jgi:hypothetical protein
MDFFPVLLGSSVNQLWFAVPLVVAISLVYGATRHEEIGPILNHAVRTGAWIVGFMLIIAAILLGFSWML